MFENKKSILELAVLLLGIALLVFIFYIAYSVFTNPGTLEGFAELVPEIDPIEFGPEGEELEIGNVVEPILEMLSYVVAAILLWVMGSIGGRITKYGVSMYKN